MYLIDDEYENVTEREFMDFCNRYACDPNRGILCDYSPDGYHHDMLLIDRHLGCTEERHMHVMSCV